MHSFDSNDKRMKIESSIFSVLFCFMHSHEWRHCLSRPPSHVRRQNQYQVSFWGLEKAGSCAEKFFA
jgi:hypothetical protein